MPVTHRRGLSERDSLNKDEGGHPRHPGHQTDTEDTRDGSPGTPPGVDVLAQLFQGSVWRLMTDYPRRPVFKTPIGMKVRTQKQSLPLMAPMGLPSLVTLHRKDSRGVADRVFSEYTQEGFIDRSLTELRSRGNRIGTPWFTGSFTSGDLPTPLVEEEGLGMALLFTVHNL